MLCAVNGLERQEFGRSSRFNYAPLQEGQPASSGKLLTLLSELIHPSVTLFRRVVTQGNELGTQNDSHVYFLSAAMSVLNKVQAGWMRGQWLRSLNRSGLQSVKFMFVLEHASVSGNACTGRLASRSSTSVEEIQTQND